MSDGSVPRGREMRGTDFELTAGRAAFAQAIFIAALLLANFANQLARRFLSWDGKITTLFDVGVDASVPTWYSSIALLACAFLLAAIAMEARRLGDRDAIYWWGLSLIMMLMSVDEVAMLHETVGVAIADGLPGRPAGRSDFLHFSWVIPGAALVLVVGLTFLRFVFRLPSRTRNLIFLSGVMFVGAALGLEMVGARYFKTHGRDTATYAALFTLEEMMEMAAIAIFLCALIDYQAGRSGAAGLRIEIGPAAGDVGIEAKIP